jgi:hypothetical protein
MSMWTFNTKSHLNRLSRFGDENRKFLISHLSFIAKVKSLRGKMSNKNCNVYAFINFGEMIRYERGKKAGNKNLMTVFTSSPTLPVVLGKLIKDA